MIPSATYRIQFRNGMTFDRVVELVPYMKDLGISHLYASPVFTATTGSTHGYDVTDPNEIDPRHWRTKKDSIVWRPRSGRRNGLDTGYCA